MDPHQQVMPLMCPYPQPGAMLYPQQQLTPAWTPPMFGSDEYCDSYFPNACDTSPVYPPPIGVPVVPGYDHDTTSMPSYNSSVVTSPTGSSFNRDLHSSASPEAPSTHSHRRASSTKASAGPANTSSTRRRNRQPSSINRKAHNDIEQKYRNTVNTAIQNLQCAVPQLNDAPNEGERPQVTKAAILIGATAYIKQLEQEREHLQGEIRSCREALMRERMLADLRAGCRQ